VISRFFIDRPIAANVIAWITLLLGAVALSRLPVEQYPQITPPTVKVSTVYPGANAQVVADTVAAPIEQQVNGVENMLYMSSTSSSDGSYSLTVTFAIGTNLDMAQVLVQNRVAIAEPQLPEEVRRQGIVTKKQSTNIILVISLTSPDGSYDDLYLANYATLELRDELSRIDGVGDVTVSGTGSYSMRVWFDPEKLKARDLTAQDLVNALAEQNVQVAAGQIGQPPAPASQNFQFTITTLGRLNDPRQFENIVIKSGPEGRVVYLRDVARVELGAQSYDQFAIRDGIPAASVLIYQLPGANAIQVAEGVRAAMKRLSKSFPPGLRYEIPFDTTLFVEAAIDEVYRTLIEAGVLVLAVILVFLQNWRAVLVPATTVPITIVGAFIFMWALGFTVNLLTLFGLVLAIGIVVDDAIVIVENAAHHIERGEAPREATIRAMAEVTGPVLGITAVLMAVFVPTAFLGGITGQLYRQFALTIAATAIISAVNALTLKPAQCARWLRPHRETRFFLAKAFNWVYARCEAAYAWAIRGLVRFTPAVVILFFMVVGLTGWWYLNLPTGLLPTEDMGYVIVSIQLPDAASLGRTREVVERINGVLKTTRGVEGWFVLGGFSLIDGAVLPNAASCYVVFTDWRKRGPELSQDAILADLRRQFGQIQDATIFAFPPPAIQGLGVTGGFQVEIEDRASVGLSEMQDAVQDLLEAARQRPELGPGNTTFRAGVPQLYADVNRVQVKTLDVRLSDVFGTLQAALGSAYVNDFNKFGRTYQVRVQADHEFRLKPEDISRLDVRNAAGGMVPLGTVVRVRKAFGPQIVTRYNMYPAAAITGAAAPGYSSGQALQLIEQLADQTLPPAMGYDWTGMSYQEKKVGYQAIGIFALAVLLVYLSLSFLYESWVIPLAVILVVPLGLLGAVAAVALRGLDNNVYTQIGVVLIIALASKNAILIVEFARELRAAGQGIQEAAVAAARLRFRPILMTSFAFIMGVLPLVRASGAGAASRQALGTAVFGGMLSSTILAVFFVPVFFVVFQWLSDLGKKTPAAKAGTKEA
jgi:hydrophobic/amphiphilic exporter-1 (mainly G- bacteria), HAE1 family